MNVSLPRSFLYVPGNAPEKLEKALTRSSDAVIVDLEDAVPFAEKETARSVVIDWLHQMPAELSVEIWVRVNPGTLMQDEVREFANIPALTGIALAKCDGAADVRVAAELLSSLGDEQTLLMPLIETAEAVLDLRDIASGPRVRQLQIGEVDLAAELGLFPGPDESELAPVRSLVVVASAAAGISPPLGPVSRITNDPEALAESTSRLQRQGFIGRACIHPAQIGVVHQVFTPSEQEISEAKTVIKVFETAEAEGRAVVLDARGLLIDPAVLRSARQTLALAARRVEG